MKAPPIVAATHEVANQPPPLEDFNLFEQDVALRAAVLHEGGAWGEARLGRFGAWLGEASTLRLGEQANQQPPVLRSHDRYGRRIDEVGFAPAWHELMGRAVAEQVHALPWVDPRPGAHVVRAASAFLLNQVESGVCCPIAMTFAALPALRAAPEIARTWAPKILSAEYDPSAQPVAAKRGAVVGMAMTEKQGGSDLRATTTRAEPDGKGYRLIGHKWFCSAPMSDAFLTLARDEAGLSCFFVPRWRADGSRNAIHLQRLKDKLGNRANASAEIEYLGASAQRIGEAGHGVRTIITMVHHTRLDAALSSAALMRQAVAQALHHAAHRSAFQKRLIDQPLMRNVLADLAAAGFARLATAVTKFWVCKRAPATVAEALECLGGNGYIEECVLPRLYREAPVNSIWEGSGNVVCLDALRTIARDPAALDAVLAELDRARGADLRLDAWLVRLRNGLRDEAEPELQARRLIEHLALALQAALLVQHGPAAVADAFCASRLADGGARQFGALPRGLDLALICERARPRLD